MLLYCLLTASLIPLFGIARAVRLQSGTIRQDAILESATNGILYGIALYFYYFAVQLPEYGEATEPATVPLALSLLLTVLTLLGSYQCCIQSEDLETASEEQTTLQIRPLSITLLLCCLYVGFIDSLGYFAATIPFLLLVSLTLRDRFLPALVIAIGWCCLVYLIFQLVLGVSLPEAPWIS